MKQQHSLVCRCFSRSDCSKFQHSSTAFTLQVVI